MDEALYDRRWTRMMTLVDEKNREALALEMGRSPPAARGKTFEAELVVLHGRPDAIGVDNGTDFVPESCSSDVPPAASAFTTFSRASPTRMPTSNAPIGRIVKRSVLSVSTGS